jgi:hypothetical protein
VTRRQLLAAATAAVVVAGIVIGSLILASKGASPSAEGKDVSESIVVIGTGGLSWSDVSPQATPALWSLLRDGATAALTVHSVHANTCPVDGWLTLSAGEEAGDASTGGGAADPMASNPPAEPYPQG